MSKKKKAKELRNKDYIIGFLVLLFVFVVELAMRGELTKPMDLPGLLILAGGFLGIYFLGIIGIKGNRKMEKKYGVEIRGRYQQVYKNGKLVKDRKLIRKVLLPNPWLLFILLGLLGCIAYVLLMVNLYQ